MIFDRTAADIKSAKTIRAAKVQTGEALTDEDIATLERGTLTINTLNRIENKQAELKAMFNSLGYWNVSSVSTKEWTYTDYFKLEDFNRILNNLYILRDAFFVFADTPAIPGNNYLKYQVINDVERILFDLDTMINDIKGKYIQCGTFQCGEENEN